MLLRRSTSGAIVVQLGEHIIKLGDGEVGARVGEQAEWLHAVRGDGIVPVTMLTSNAYVMPVLNDWQPPIVARDLWDRLTHLLETWVWSRPPMHTGEGMYPMQHKLTRCRAALLHDGSSLLDLASQLMHDVDWHMLPRCLTHGDPTFANTMCDTHGELVLIDPLPSTWDVPDIRAKDIGKLLQTSMGYEREILGQDFGLIDPFWAQDLCMSSNEWRAAKFFGVLHIIRLIPYVAREGKNREWATHAAETIARL